MTCLSVALDHDAWLEANTAYCKRHRVRLTTDACLRNQKTSAGERGDLRCAGCGGLANQPEEVKDLSRLYLVYPHQDTAVETDDTGADEIDEPQELDEAVRSVEAPEHETTLDLDDLAGLDDLVLDLDDETLAAITNGNSDFCRELASLLADQDASEEAPEQAQEEPARAKREERPRRYAVFTGRCPRCDGYMDNTREREDDDIYRCLACGWRTSPAYEWNRANPELSGWRG